MKKNSLVALSIIGLLTLNSCGQDKKTENTTEIATPTEHHSEMETETTSGNLDDGKEAVTPKFTNEALAAVYQDYLDLKTALVNTNGEEAKTLGAELVASLEQAEDADAALKAAKSIAEQDDIREQRNAFSDLSAAVETMLAGNLASGEVYKQYCPMAFDGAGGYWLSNSEEVRNPYYGDMMLKCGRVEDTLK